MIIDCTPEVVYFVVTRCGKSNANYMVFNANLDLDSGMYQEFDDFEVTLGDIMRGERATRGKSITDVRLELRLPKSYILAIENGDLSAFRCPEFVRGYIYSYAHYLGLDPIQAFSTFCLETGFSLPTKCRQDMRTQLREWIMSVAANVSVEISWPVRLRFLA